VKLVKKMLTNVPNVLITLEDQHQHVNVKKDITIIKKKKNAEDVLQNVKLVILELMIVLNVLILE